MMNAVSVNCSVESGLCSSSAIRGSAGRYMSIDNGAKADRPPRMSAYRMVLGFVVTSVLEPSTVLVLIASSARRHPSDGNDERKTRIPDCGAEHRKNQPGNVIA